MSGSQISSVVFRRYKAFREFHVSLQEFNALVGPNNCGKSTIISAFRILAEGIRRARARSATPLQIRGHVGWGYAIGLEGLPIAGENVFYNYDDSQHAEILFRISNGNTLRLHFPERDTCYLICDSRRKAVRTPSDFRREFNLEIGFVPILGPVEHKELLFQKEAARLALLSPGASRNFRNIWRHYPDDFEQFRALIIKTWPGMDIEPPELVPDPKGSMLRMFCSEERFPREIYWAGYGFQVWCQMLTHIVKAKNASLLVIDEPDIYLHSDLQRQLVALLKELGPDILIATHSTEIISEVDPPGILSIDKRQQSARHLKDATQVRKVFTTLGSNLNPILTHLARTRRALFVEGGDFQILSAFARSLGNNRIANRSDFAVVPMDGFNPRRAVDLARGVELTLGAKIERAIILDRDYRSDEEVREIASELKKEFEVVHIYKWKELENYLLDPFTIEKVVTSRIASRSKRTGEPIVKTPNCSALLEEITEPLKAEVTAQYLARRTEFLRKQNPQHDPATHNVSVLKAFEEDWKDIGRRLQIAPGKHVLALLSERLQKELGLSISVTQITAHTEIKRIPREIVQLIKDLAEFCK